MTIASGTRSKANPHIFFDRGEIDGAPGLVAALCGACGRHTIARPAACIHCLGRDLKIVAAGQAGEVLEASVVHHPAGGFDAPYVIAQIRTDEGMVLFSPILGDAAPIEPGARVRFALFDRRDGVVGFGYRRAEAEGFVHAGA